MTGDVCSECAHPVRTMITLGGKVIDLDPNPDENGVVEIVKDKGRIRAHVVPSAQMPINGLAYRFHRCTPDLRPAPGPPCAVCLDPMPRGIAVEQKWTTHPGCDLPEAREAARLSRRRRR